MTTEPVSRPRLLGTSRRKFLAGLVACSVGGATYARWIEPTWLEVARREVRLPAAVAGPPVKLLHVSDLHASPEVSLRFIARAIDEGLRLEPDLVCLTGDFITWTYEAFAEYAAVLARLAAVAPTYACLGNHDGGEWARPRGGYPDTRQVRQLLRESRVELLDNAMTSVHPAGRKLTLIGLGDGWAGEFDPGRAFAEAPASGGWPRLVLSHNPDTKNLLLAFGWHLMLCGHTHGGQCELPLIGTPFAPVNDKRFVRGLQAWENRWIHITKGVGNVHGLRFNCRPEVSLLTLV